MPLADRATVANMAPEYGATVGYFPIDDETLRYLRDTGRSDAHVALVHAYAQAQGLLALPGAPVPEYSERLRLDLATVEPSLAGPKRPQDRVPLGAVPAEFRQSLRRPVPERGFGLEERALGARSPVDGAELTHGSVVIAAITSCTNTSNPSVMVGAGLVARKAAERGMKPKPWVKTSLAPGSRVVTDYLQQSGLQRDLDALGFHTVGYGCTTCIGNSGPLPPPVAAAIRKQDLVAAAVLSGNRNFEGRVNPDVKANYLASPPLVVAYALAGRIDVDLQREPIGKDRSGKDVFLTDLWPSSSEIADLIRRTLTPEMFRARYATALTGPEAWQQIEAPTGSRYRWREDSTYIHEPPYFQGVTPAPPGIRPIRGARVLVMLGDSVTTDHISPAGSIKADSPAGRWLQEHGVTPHEFNSYGARRGNDLVMTRGTFANIRLRNQLAPGTEGGVTRLLPGGEILSIFDAAMRYRADQIPLAVLAGKEYGAGSSRDWAAKGTFLLGVRFVLAESYERIHRSNLVGMGVLPLEYLPGQDARSHRLTGEETFDLDLPSDLQPRATLELRVQDRAGTRTIPVRSRIDTPVEIDYFRNGGILPYVLRRLAAR
jgi:aconitate hydratase